MRISDWSSDVCSSDLNNFRTQPQVGNIDGTRVPANGINIGKDGRGDVSGKTIGVRRSRKLRKRAENARRPLRPCGASVRRSEERRVGTAVVMTGRYRWAPGH